MTKAQLKPYFEAHPSEKELYLIGNQVFMGSQKVAAQNYAANERKILADCLHSRESVVETPKSVAK